MTICFLLFVVLAVVDEAVLTNYLGFRCTEQLQLLFPSFLSSPLCLFLCIGAVPLVVVDVLAFVS